ncbi:unnamed protein product [Nyctereutes procyonoides]|uniref:(raccoon dog) hypothetical protein n=1 Tax=Nyctereutes procyonoides TaxID=34880 RepID=A0A811ZC30_NYCPR|nr:unnamed protein product [Nyctereutes procyonoides]
METPGSAPWAGPRGAGPGARPAPAHNSRPSGARGVSRSPLAPGSPTAARRARAPTPLPAAGGTAGRFPRGTPPSSPGRRGEGLLPPRNRKDARSTAGRGLRGVRPGAGPRGRHCAAPGAEPGIGQQGAGQGRGLRKGTLLRGELLPRASPFSGPQRTPVVKISVREKKRVISCQGENREPKTARRIKAAPIAEFREGLTCSLRLLTC